MPDQLHLDEYRTKAYATAIYKDVEIYPILGIVNEVGEFCQKLLGPRDTEELKAELGDIMWYAAALAFDFGFSLNKCTEGVTETSSAITDLADFKMLFAATELAGRYKKILRGDYDTDENAMSDALSDLQSNVGRIVVCVYEICDILEITMDDVTQANLDKLQDRQERGVLQGDGDNR
jgi:NTP pyrophosphatase (non-canonical NTP hydrolase)